MEKLRFGELFLARVSSVTSVTPDSVPCFLSPSESNIHKIESVGGPAAFLDILAPPYNIDPDPYMDDQEERDCHYFRVLSEPVAEVGNLFAIDQLIKCHDSGFSGTSLAYDVRPSGLVLLRHRAIQWAQHPRHVVIVRHVEDMWNQDSKKV